MLCNRYQLTIRIHRVKSRKGKIRPWKRVSCQRSPRPALAVLPVALGVLDTDSVTGWGCIGPFLRCARHDPDLEPTIEAVGVVARELECFPGSL